MDYDNETVPNVVGAVPGDASPAVLYGPRFTLQTIKQVRFWYSVSLSGAMHEASRQSEFFVQSCWLHSLLNTIKQSSSYPGGPSTITIQVATSVPIQLNLVWLKLFNPFVWHESHQLRCIWFIQSLSISFQPQRCAGFLCVCNGYLFEVYLPFCWVSQNLCKAPITDGLPPRASSICRVLMLRSLQLPRFTCRAVLKCFGSHWVYVQSFSRTYFITSSCMSFALIVNPWDQHRSLSSSCIRLGWYFKPLPQQLYQSRWSLPITGSDHGKGSQCLLQWCLWISTIDWWLHCCGWDTTQFYPN